MNPLTLKITAEHDGRTIKSMLEHELCMSNSHISRLKRRQDGVLLNGKRAYVTQRVRSGDELAAQISDAPNTLRLEAVQMPLKIAYEDEWMLVVDKPAGITVHPERSGEGGSVENALTAYLKEGEYCHTVSRLDRGTSGLMAVAKCGYMHERLRRILHTPDFVKVYTAVAEGVVPKSGTVTLPLDRCPGEHNRMCASEGGKSAETRFERLEVFRVEGVTMSLVRLLPVTGRMHQIRVHMSAIEHPLLGDRLYGKASHNIDHAALHSSHLQIKHPLTGERIDIDSPLPQEIALLMNM